MHPAGYQCSDGQIKGGFMAVVPCRTVPCCGSLDVLPFFSR
ncbi:MAG: hypothetical protein OJF49_002423 [Ktedonobacterales bacterium]|nr:MAG: hypothetical protein OJF49_002423 [Ktedonobacterales bacterium]